MSRGSLNNLTSQQLNELQKDFLSKSVQLSDNDKDTDMSTKGSLRSYSHSQFMDSFPDVLNQNQKPSGFVGQSSDRKRVKRRSSFTAIPVQEEDQKEIEYEDEQEEEEQEKKTTWPHVNMMKDFSEFSMNIQTILERNNKWSCESTKQRTNSVDKLPKVLEEDEQQEEVYEQIHSKLDNLIDQNEFNCTTPTTIRRVSQKRISMNLQQNQETIQEVNECEKIEVRRKNLSIFSISEQSVNSPRYKLKVDELDQKNQINREPSFNYPIEEKIEPIQEDEDKKEPQTNAERIFEGKIGKLHKEYDYLINNKDFEFQQKEAESMGQIQEQDDSCSDDEQISSQINIQDKKDPRKRQSLQHM